MSERLRRELKLRKPLSLEAEAFLHVVKTAETLMQGVAEALKDYDLSPTQYNVLRILRGAGGAGLACSEVAERMVNRDPDITRLMDRLEKGELVSRTRDKKDRRVVTAKITPKGLELVARLDEPMKALQRRQLGRLGENNLKQLVALLERVREQAGA